MPKSMRWEKIKLTPTQSRVGHASRHGKRSAWPPLCACSRCRPPITRRRRLPRRPPPRRSLSQARLSNCLRPHTRLSRHDSCRVFSDGDAIDLDLAGGDLVMAPEDHRERLRLVIRRPVLPRRRMLKVVRVEVFRVPLVDVVLTLAAAHTRRRGMGVCQYRDTHTRSSKRTPRARTLRAAWTRCPVGRSRRHCSQSCT